MTEASGLAIAKRSQYAGFKWLAPVVAQRQMCFFPATHDGFDEARFLHVHPRALRCELKDTEHLWVFGTSAIPLLLRKTRHSNPLRLAKGSTIFITDGQFWRMRRFVLRLAQEASSRLFVMPDLAPWIPVGIKWKPFFQLIELPDPDPYELGQKDSILLSHSPRPNWKDNQKGSVDLLRAAAAADVKLTLISSSSWDDVIRLKRKSRFFIDQCVDFGRLSRSRDAYSSAYSIAGQISRLLAPSYKGGLGKSGIEALKAGAVVASSGNPLNCGGFFPEPPIYNLTTKGLVAELRRLVAMGDNERNDLRGRQQAWTAKYLSQDFILSHVLEGVANP